MIRPVSGIHTEVGVLFKMVQVRSLVPQFSRPPNLGTKSVDHETLYLFTEVERHGSQHFPPILSTIECLDSTPNVPYYTFREFTVDRVPFLGIGLSDPSVPRSDPHTYHRRYVLHD